MFSLFPANKRTPGTTELRMSIPKNNTSFGDGLPNTGFVRLSGIIAPKGPLPISKSSWWEGVKAQRYPQPVKLGPRITAWRCEDVHAYIERQSSGGV